MIKQNAFTFPGFLNIFFFQYQVRSIPGKGLGAVAERRIRAGELVMREEPFLSLPLTDGGDLEGRFDPRQEACSLSFCLIRFI